MTKNIYTHQGGFSHAICAHTAEQLGVETRLLRTVEIHLDVMLFHSRVENQLPVFEHITGLLWYDCVELTPL